MAIAIILAGGSGTRMGATAPKQFLRVNGKPIIAYTLEAFATHEEVDGIVVVCRKDRIAELNEIIAEFGIRGVKKIAPEGASRQQSSFIGLNAAKEVGAADDSVVLIHDAVRPLVSHRIITECIKTAGEYGAANTVIPATDTIIKSGGEFADEVLNRNELFHVQTPQAFRFGLIYGAHEDFLKDGGVSDATDDCQMIMKTGGRVALVTGEKSNFKITTPEDLLLFEAIVGLHYSRVTSQ